MRLAPGQIGGWIAPGLGISEERLLNRVGREVIVVFDHNGLVRLCDGLSVDCDFDHLHVWFVVLWVDDGAERKGEIRNLRGCPARFLCALWSQPERPMAPLIESPAAIKDR